MRTPDGLFRVYQSDRAALRPSGVFEERGDASEVMRPLVHALQSGLDAAAPDCPTREARSPESTAILMVVSVIGIVDQRSRSGCDAPRVSLTNDL
jgi:hypothetical protein